MGLSWLLVWLTASTGLLAADAPVVDRIVAVVNEDIITQYDVENAIRPMLAGLKSQRLSPEQESQALARLRAEMLNNLIDIKLTEQEIKRYNITVSDEDVESHIREIQRRQSVTDEGLKGLLAEQGMSLEDYRKEVKTQLQRSKLVTREVRSKVVITQAEIKDYYEKNKARYGGGAQYHLWNLFVKLPPEATAQERQDAQALLQNALEELKKGRSFQELVRITEDGRRGVLGSDLGWYRIEELTPQLREVVKDVRAGQHTGVVETDFGYQILYVEEVKEAVSRPLDKVESEIQDILYRQYVEDRFSTWLSELRKRSHIRIMEAP
jgi:peptidyl-prolyl cis-trans isomerase SurA